MWGSVDFSCTSPSQISQYFFAKAMSCTPDDSDASCNQSHNAVLSIMIYIVILAIMSRKPLKSLSENRLHKPGSASDFRRKPTTQPHFSEKVCLSGLPDRLEKASEGDDWPDRWKERAAELRATNNDDFIQTFRLWGKLVRLCLNLHQLEERWSNHHLLSDVVWKSS